MKRLSLTISLLLLAFGAIGFGYACEYKSGAFFPSITVKAVAGTKVPTATRTPTVVVTPTATPVPGATFTPWPAAPLCASHVFTEFHTLWNAVDGCHYDHEHGQNPFVPEVAAVFPGFDLFALNGGVGVGHGNLSGPAENTSKHAGFKWDVTIPVSPTGGCVNICVDALAIQYHNFGVYSIEFETRVHTAVGLLRMHRASDPTDYGYAYLSQFQDYGQRVAPYQGAVLPYPDTPNPAFNPATAPYFSTACFGGIVGGTCGKYPTRQYILDRNANTDSTWVSRPQDPAFVGGSDLFSILFRVRDTFQALDFTDLTYSFTFAYLCSADGGLTFTATPGCRWNNSTSRIHEVHGEIPAEWDNLAGFDTDARAGRITAEGYTTHYGDLAPMCLPHDDACHPIKLVAAFVGSYSTPFQLNGAKGSFSPENTPERDIHFCAGLPCAETSPGAVPSGWIGPAN